MDLFSSGGIFVLKVVGVVLIYAVLYYAIASFFGARAFKEEREDRWQRARPFSLAPGPSRSTLVLSAFATYLIAWVWLDWF